ncbi:UNVERIFIED_CONTAM: hypothetical protein GTU68_018974 [Idotea baltica]|nr:hypothetical protein [Idotea baltica]
MSYDLKKEEDVKEFLDNLGIEYRFGCFNEKNPSSCHLLGDYLESVKKDFEKAAKVYRSNCDDSSHPKSCYKYANYRFLGKGLKKDLPDASKYYDKGCTAGDKDACLNGGLLCVSNSKANEELPKNYTKGLELLTKACEKENAFSCHYLSGMYIIGVEDQIPKDMTKAFKFSSKGCELGNMQACANVSQMYRKGDGVEQNLVKSEEFKKKALDMQKQLIEATQVEFQQGT